MNNPRLKGVAGADIEDQIKSWLRHCKENICNQEKRYLHHLIGRKGDDNVTGEMEVFCVGLQ